MKWLLITFDGIVMQPSRNTLVYSSNRRKISIVELISKGYALHRSRILSNCICRTFVPVAIYADHIRQKDQTIRRQAMLQALVATLIRPAGAQSSTQSPHVVDCRGVLSISTSYLPAPTVSPIAPNFREQSASIAATLNKLAPGSVHCRVFDCLASGIAHIEELMAEMQCTH